MVTPTFDFTSIYPCTEQNYLAYQMVAKMFDSGKSLIDKDTSLNRAAYLKEYAKDKFSEAYDASECFTLGKLQPTSNAYFSALAELLNWRNPWDIEHFWQWYNNKFSIRRLLLRPLNPVLVFMLNYLMDLDCNVKDWNQCLLIVGSIDLYRLAGMNVSLTLEERVVHIKGFTDG